MSSVPLIENPTLFFTPEELAFADQGVTPSGEPAPQLRRACDKPEDIAQTFVDVFNDLGGHQFLLEWAEDNPGAFLNHMKTLAPRQQQVTQDTKAVLTIRHALPRSKLDGYDEAEDAQIVPNEPEIIENTPETPPISTKRRKKGQNATGE